MAKQGNSQQETAPPAETAAPVNETPKFDVSTLDEFGQAFLSRLVGQITERNSVAAEIKANSTDPGEIAEGTYDGLKNGVIPEGMSDETVTPDVLAEYDAIVSRELEIAATLRTAAEKFAAEKAAAGTDAEKVATLTTTLETLDKKIRQARNLLTTEYPGAESTLPDIAKSGGKTGGTGKGAGGRKLRGFTVSVDGTVAYLGKDEDKKSSFAAGATVLGIPTPELQAAYFQATGTDDVEKLPASQTFTVKGADEKEHQVTAERNPA